MTAHIHPAFEQIREKALAWRDPQAPAGSPSGIVMETGYAEGVVLLVVMSDGTADLYFSRGGGVMGAGVHPGPKQAARDLAIAAHHLGPRMPVGFDYPLPPPGVVNLFVLMDGVVRHVTGAEQDFGQNKSPFSPLFHAAHHVIAEMRRIPPPEQRG